MQEEVGSLQPARGSSLEPDHAGTLPSSFQKWGNKCLLFLSHPVYGILVVTAQARKDTITAHAGYEI